MCAVQEDSKLQLALQLLSLLEAPLGLWTCSNSQSASHLANCSASTPEQAAALLLRTTAVAPGAEILKPIGLGFRF